MTLDIPPWIGQFAAAARTWLAKTEPWRFAVLALAAAIALMFGLLPAPAGVPPTALLALGLGLATVLLWATVAISQSYAAMLFVGFCLLTGAARTAATLSGFASPTLLLVFGGLLIGLAAERSGFGRFVAQRFFGRFRGTYPRLVLGVLIGTTLLSFFVPANMGRLAITVPIVLALAAEAGYERGSPGHIGLILACVVGNFTVAITILPANLLNVMVIGTGETLYGVRVSYLEYFLLCLPVLGLAKGLLVWATIVRLLPAPPPKPTSDAPAPLNAEARRVAAVLAVTIALWATDMLHGLRPGFVAVAAGLTCLLLRLGGLTFRDALDTRKLLILVWIGTVLSLGAVLTESGAGRLVSGVLADWTHVAGRSPLYGHLVLAYLTGIMTSVATIGGAVPVMVSAAGDIAAATGLPLKSAILSVTAGMSVLALPYVAAPIVVGLAMGQVPERVATRFMVVLGLLTALLILPLNALYWALIGFVP